MNRRYFFLGASAALAVGPRSIAASDRVNVALIGLRGRGQTMAQWFGALPDVRIPVVCDVDQTVVGPVMKSVSASQGRTPVLIGDIRRVLDDKSIDTVVMATPIHWHAAGTILACQAGKDVYVEKPASHSIREGRLMIEAAQRHKRIVQVGMQSRSRPVTERFVQLVQSGKLGVPLMAKVWNVQGRSNIGHRPDEPAPATLDYDTWTGPVPLMPFNRNRFHGTTNWHWNYGCGDIGNDGVHWIDIARWALQVDLPTEVSGMGRKLFFEDDQQTPDTMNITYNYSTRVIQFEQRLWNKYALEGSENTVAVYGTAASAQVGRWDGGHHAIRLFDGKGKLVSTDQEPSPDYNTHARNFIDCMRTRKKPNADIEAGHISAAMCHLGNIVARTGRPVRFDPKTEIIVADPGANKLVGRSYRSHWSTPKDVKA